MSTTLLSEAPVRATAPGKRARVTAKGPAPKLAHQRLSVLELAQQLGHVAEAGRRSGMDRTSFYEWKRRFQPHGFAGLVDLPPVARSHPQTTPPETVERIVALSLEHPAWGGGRLAALLKLEGLAVSSPTIQGILAKHGLATRYERLLKLEQRAHETPINLTAEQLALIEQANPAFAERHVESSRPGAWLAQDLFYVGHLKGVGQVYLNAVVDTYSSSAFGFLHAGKAPEHAVAGLHHDVLPFYTERELAVGAVLTDRQRAGVCGHRAAPLRTRPRPQRPGTPTDQGAPPLDQRFRRARPAHRPRRVLPRGLPDHAR